MSERKQLTIEQATKCLHNGKYIHVYREKLEEYLK